MESGFLGDLDTSSKYDGKYDFTVESAFQIMAESEVNHTSIMKAMGIAELSAFTEGIDYMSLDEATGGIFAFWNFSIFCYLLIINSFKTYFIK